MDSLRSYRVLQLYPNVSVKLFFGVDDGCDTTHWCQKSTFILSQSLNEEKDHYDDEAISFVYQQQSYASQAVARQLALKDQVDARLYLGLEESEQPPAPVSFENTSSPLDSPERSSILPSAA